MMIVSDAFEECPICRPWERRVLSISGAPGYPSVDEARAAGLFHGNCRHSMAPYIKGLTTGRLTYRKEKPRFDTRADKDRMRQRHMERQIRKWKRRQAVAITPKDVALAAAKVRQWQGAIRTFTAQTGRRRLYYREGGAVPRAAATGESTLGVSRAAGYSHPKAARADELWELQAEKLAQRHGMTLAEWEAAANANYASILARSELSTQVDDYTLQLILADKRFKSQFETGTSMGLFSHEARSKAESNLFGVPANLPARERPIYGHMFDPEVGDIGEALSYGEVQVVFKPSVRSRTTITGMDSLELGDGEFTPSAKPSPLTNPSVRSVKVFDAGTESSFLHRDPLVATQLNKVHVSYTEAQIHGGVRTSDIDRVIFAHDPPSPQTERMLDEAGIPWVFDPDRDRL